MLHAADDQPLPPVEPENLWSSRGSRFQISTKRGKALLKDQAPTAK